MFVHMRKKKGPFVFMKHTDMDCETAPLRRSEATAVSRVSMLSMQLLLAMNAALMFVVLMSGWSMYQDVSSKLRSAEELVSAPEKLVPYAEVIIRDAATSFLLGALNGSIAQFAADMVRPDVYASLATTVNSFSGSVINAFGGSPPLACQNFVTCPNSNNGYPFALECSTGSVVWCQYGGQQINCADQTCVSPYVYSVATMVNTISGLMTQLSAAPQAANNGAAFNSGLLNLEAIIPWVQRQANANDWFNAGVRCQNLVQRVNSVSWNGEYVDFNGRTHIFNETRKVTEVTGYVKQVCDNLVQLSTQQKK